MKPMKTEKSAKRKREYFCARPDYLKWSMRFAGYSVKASGWTGANSGIEFSVETLTSNPFWKRKGIKRG